MSGGPTGIVMLGDDRFLELFSYMGFDEGNAALLDIDSPKSNLLRGLSADEKHPVLRREMKSFDAFRQAFIDPIEESCGRQSLGLAFRGQAAEHPLHSGLKRFWDRVPYVRSPHMVVSTPRREGVYRIRDVNAVVQAYLFQDGQVPLPNADHLYAILQHYGAPTPLLDWTLDLKTALFFAFEHAPEEGCEHVAI